MNNSKLLFEDVRSRILSPDSNDEVEAIAYLLLEALFDLTRTNVVAASKVEVSSEQMQLLDGLIERVNAHEPIQYVLGSADFLGRKFNVNKHVLIPRPETEELVLVVKSFLEKRDVQKRFVLDIGTGSGCIPITLALEVPHSKTIGIDISDEALRVAAENANALKASVTFLKTDILKEDIPFSDLDVIVSNPPYIAGEEAASMKENVLLYEPHLALFVDNGDVLTFYKAIARRGFDPLVKGGMLAFETNEKFAYEVKSLMERIGYRDVKVQQDINGKDRIVFGIK